MVQNNACINDSNKPTIEIKTLAQDVSEASDKTLAALMNEGWELLCDPAINTVPVPDALGPGWRARHYEIIKLFRLVDGEDGGAEEEDVNTSVEALREMVKRINTANTTPTPLRKEERGENGSPPLMPLNEVKRGTVLGVDAEHPLHVERKPLEEVTYTEALYSGLYTPEEVSEIGDREARALTLANLKWEKQQWGDRSWEGFVNCLPMRPFKCSPRVIDGVAT